MPPSICFVTPQIYPGTAGGIGRLIQANALVLAQAGWNVTFLLDVPDEALHRFRRYQTQVMPATTVATPTELLTSLPSGSLLPASAFAAEAHWRAYRLALALDYLLRQQPFDGVELVDYQGSGYVIAQWRRLLGGPLRQTRLWLRLHGTSELCQQVDGRADLSSAAVIQHQMERYTLAHVDGWLAPSPALARQYQSYYQLHLPVVAQAPAFERLRSDHIHPRQIDRQNIRLLFYGKIQALKGADLFVQAAVQLCQQLDVRIEFDLVGGEDPGLLARFGSYTDWLRGRIPLRFQDRFHFYGSIEPTRLPALAQAATLAIIPSRFETFCLAAHELNWLGVPLVLNDIPAFADYFTHGQNCLKFDGTAEHLAAVLYTAITDVSPFSDWDRPIPPAADDPIGVYQTVLHRFQLRLVPIESPPVTAAIVRHTGSALDLYRTLAVLTAVSPRLSKILVVPSPGFDVPGVASGCVVPTVAQAVTQIDAPYVLLLDSPASLLPEYWSRLRQAQTNAPTAGVISCYTRQVDVDSLVASIPNPPDLRLLFFENRLHLSGSVFKREILQRYWLDPISVLAGDWEFWLQLVAVGVEIEVIPQTLHIAPSPSPLPPLAVADQLSKLLTRHPDLMQQVGADVIKLYAFNYHHLVRNFSHHRRTWETERRELEDRFNSRHVISRQFVELTRSTILEVSRNPRQVWQKVCGWLSTQVRPIYEH